jgi:thiamine biosynthesis lipoprotein
MTSPLSPTPSPLAAEQEPSPLRRFLIPSAFVLLCFAALFYRQPTKQTQPPAYWTIQGAIFGTSYTVKLRSPKKGALTKEKLAKELHQALDAVDWQMSTYKKQSELSRFNAFQSTETFQASPALFKVIEAAQETSRMSGGAFDITIGPIVNAWGFGPKKLIKPPSTAELNAARARVGYQKLLLDAKKKTLRKMIPSLYVDLSAIAKGYGVDILAEGLERQGIFDYMAEIGGEVRTRGLNAQGQIWRVGIEKPKSGTTQDVHLIVALRDAAMATSGNYRNYIMHDGRRVSHLIDARSASPVAHNLASVSVIHNNCMMADALATALYVLGAEDGLKIAKQHRWAVLFLIPNGSTFQQIASPAFEAYLRPTSHPNPSSAPSTRQ